MQPTRPLPAVFPGFRPAARGLAVLALASLAGAAQAHTGHGAEGFAAGVAHPFGADHLLAMLAVGLWSVRALPAGRVALGPLVFLLALCAGAALGAAGVAMPGLEPALALSVLVFGLMIVASVRRPLPVVPGLALVAAGALLHGLAHGAEAPATGGFASYTAGFLIATVLLHGAGVSAGLVLRRAWAERAASVWSGLGLIIGAAGLVLVSQVA